MQMACESIDSISEEQAGECLKFIARRCGFDEVWRDPEHGFVYARDSMHKEVLIGRMGWRNPNVIQVFKPCSQRDLLAAVLNAAAHDSVVVETVDMSGKRRMAVIVPAGETLDSLLVEMDMEVISGMRAERCQMQDGKMNVERPWRASAVASCLSQDMLDKIFKLLLGKAGWKWREDIFLVSDSCGSLDLFSPAENLHAIVYAAEHGSPLIYTDSATHRSKLDSTQECMHAWLEHWCKLARHGMDVFIETRDSPAMAKIISCGTSIDKLAVMADLVV